MTRIRKLIPLFLVLMMLAVVAVSGASASDDPDGFILDYDGANRYYVDGDYVTGVYEIGSFPHYFDDADGAYKGVYDDHTGVGNNKLTQSVAYENALKAIVNNGGTIYGYYTFDDNESYTDDGFVSETEVGKQYGGAGSLYSTLIHTKIPGVFTSDKSHHFQLVNRYSVSTFSGKAGGGRHVNISSSNTTNAHSYANISIGAPAGADIVIEGEYMLGEGYSTGTTLVQLIDRKNVDSGGNYMPNILSVNANGGVYLSHDLSRLICVLGTERYTRISIAVHPSTNTMDVYINGLMVAEGERFLGDDGFNAAAFEFEELRTAQFQKPNSGSMYMDNFAIYGASAPVSTVTATPKNGLMLEGGVLRYYENNLLYVGKKLISGTYLGMEINKELYFGGVNGKGGAVIGNDYTVVVNGNVRDSGMSEGNVFKAPAAPAATDGVFGAWIITDGDKKTIVSPGQLYVMTGDITCDAMMLDFELLKGASIRTTEGSSGIRFMAKLDKEQYNYLTEAGIKVERHMLIVPTAYLDNTHGYYTLDALDGAGYKEKIDIKATEWYSETEGAYYYTGSVANILPENYMLEYSGVAYLKITYPNGATNIVYADHVKADHSRSVYRVAHAAYNDRITGKSNPGYLTSVTFDGTKTYSPYAPERLAIIKGFADKVIMLESDFDNVKIAGDFYDAPYSIKATYNASTQKYDVEVSSGEGWLLTDANGVVVNGEVLSKDDYTVGDKCKFSVKTGGQDITALKLDVEPAQSWLMLDATKDYSTFSGKNTNSQYCGTGESASVIMKYNKSSYSVSPANVSTMGKYTRTKVGSTYYWDLSDIKALSFSIYSTMDGQTLQLIFASENSATEGSDYYGRKLNLSKGWNHFTYRISQFSTSRTPLGWDKISGVTFTSTGWSQNNSTSNVIYMSNIVAYNREDAAMPFSNAKLASNTVFYPGGHYVYVNGTGYAASENVNGVPVENDGVYYAPVAAIAAGKGATGKLYLDKNTLVYTYNGKAYTFEVGNKTYTVDGTKAKLKTAPIIANDTILLDVKDVMTLFGYTHSYYDRMGMVVLGNSAIDLNETRDFDFIYDAIELMTYVRPSGAQIVSDLNEYSGGQHPYLMINNDGFNRLRFYAEVDKTLQGYIASLEATYGIGSGHYNDEVNVYQITDGMRLLSISRDVMSKTIAWALLAKLYEVKDPARAETYAERCWKEIESACNFKDENGLYSWHPQHFLDTGELAYPTAICYDWLYDYWVETASDVDTEKYGYAAGTTRLSVMEDAMYWMGLSVTSALPSDTTGKYITYNYNIAGAGNNWNGVCSGGMMAAALAICNVDRYAENVEKYLSYGITAIESGMWVYAPDGGYEEGPGYWSYGTTYTHVLISSLNTACGTNYGVFNAPGFAKSVYFTTYLGNKNTTWGFHDGGSGSADTSVAAWFAKEMGDPNVNAIRRQAIEKGWKGVSMYDIMYFDPHLMQSDITLTLDSYYSLDTIMTFRSSWDSNDNMFVGLHGGDNAASHGDLDIGNFVINVNGAFIISDLGSDSYNMAGYFGCYRWSYYRKRAEGQNTLVMVPSSTNVNGEGWDGKTGTPALKPGEEASNTVANTNLPTPDQLAGAISKATRFESGENSALGVVEMAPAFEQMTDGIRGLYMTNNRKTVIIQDEAVFSENMDIWWFAHTQGDITVSADGRSAVIDYNGTYLYAEIVTDMSASAKFSVMEAESLDRNYTGWTEGTDYYTDDTERNRSSISKLTVRVDDCSELRLAVAFTVIYSKDDTPALGSLYAWQDIDEWTVD